MHSTMRRCFFFFFLNRPRTFVFLLFLLNLLQNKFHYFSIQGDRNTGLLWTTNYRIDYIIKRCHEGNAIMSGLYFSQNKPSRFSLDKRQIFSASSCRVFEWTLIALRFNMINNLSCLFIFFLFMVVESLWKCLIRLAFWVPLHAMSMFD